MKSSDTLGVVHGVRNMLRVAFVWKTRTRLFMLQGDGSAPPILETSADLPRDAANEEGAAIGFVIEAAEQAKLRSILDEADGPVAIHGIDFDYSNIGVTCWCPDIRADFDVAHDFLLARTSDGLVGGYCIYLSLDDAVPAYFTPAGTSPRCKIACSCWINREEDTSTFILVGQASELRDNAELRSISSASPREWAAFASRDGSNGSWHREHPA